MRRASNSSDDFFKGGGRIPWWAAGISIFATMLSAITYMSIPAKAYATDWTYYPMQICILLVSFPVIKYYLPFFRRLNVTTAYEYLERRFNSATRLMASILFIVFMVARTALVLFLPSLAMTAVTGINIYICIALMALITILYCTMGGVEAVVWGDVIQGIILVGGAILAAVYLIVNTGENGASDFWQIAGGKAKRLAKYGFFDMAAVAHAPEKTCPSSSWPTRWAYPAKPSTPSRRATTTPPSSCASPSARCWTRRWTSCSGRSRRNDEKVLSRRGSPPIMRTLKGRRPAQSSGSPFVNSYIMIPAATAAFSDRLDIFITSCSFSDFRQA